MDPELSQEFLERPFQAVREACSEVAARARFVAIDGAALERWADALPRELGSGATAFPALSDAESLAAWVLCLDAMNFGSGWFPLLRKRPGLSGYRTLERCLRERFERAGPFAARELRAIDARAVAELLEQAPVTPPLDALLELWARALRELGEQIQTRAGGSFAGFVEEAGGSAAALVRSLLVMPLWRDIARYDGQSVPFLKRAQLAVSDLAHALPDDLGRFRDLSELTIFADNLVPHVLRLDGVLRFAPELVARIEAEELVEAGSLEEIEIRACAVDAVEQIAARLRARGRETTPRELDDWLWRRGGEPRYKARPRHRTRCPYY
ncbi:MAG TPA: queuosine salvage family protein [Myxococcota bacterium]|nr:queuosine salvage family protein [Myxococcota bacterium]